jgi:hypothetical protein
MINAFLKNFMLGEIVLVGHEFPIQSNVMEWRIHGEIVNLLASHISQKMALVYK